MSSELLERFLNETRGLTNVEKNISETDSSIESRLSRIEKMLEYIDCKLDINREKIDELSFNCKYSEIGIKGELKKLQNACNKKV